MNKNELREECLRLFKCDSIGECIESIDIYSAFLLQAILDHHRDDLVFESEKYAKMISQMILTKLQNIKSIISGFTCESIDGRSLNNIVDPTVLNMIVRNLYETIAAFNLIYRNPKSEDEKLIKFNLWAIAGLKYRQRFEKEEMTKEHRTKLEEEKSNIETLKNGIYNTSLYNNLDAHNQKFINTRINKKEFLITFDKNRVRLHKWHELIQIVDLKEKMFENSYRFFSLHVHPSYVSVFQFESMFNSDKAYLDLANTSTQFALNLTSVFIADLIFVFPKTLETFEKLSSRDQILINFRNTLSRNKDYSINDSASLIN